MEKNINLDVETNDDIYFLPLFRINFSDKEYLPNWYQHYANEGFAINYLQKSGLSIDKFSQFPPRPNELQSIIGMIGNYYHWFYIIMKKNVEFRPNEYGY